MTEFVAQVNADRSAMDNYASRVDGLDAPGDMGHAQSALELAYELRGSAMTEIAEQDEHRARRRRRRESDRRRSPAQMRKLLASDVLYAAVVRPEINGVLADNGIEGDDVPKSVFLPDETKWLDESDGRARRSARSAAAATAKPPACTASACSAPASTAPNWSPNATTAVASRRNAGSRSRSRRTRANRPRTASPSRSPSSGGASVDQTISSIGAGETQTVVDPADAGADAAKSRSKSKSQPVPGEQVTEQQRSQPTRSPSNRRRGGRVRIAYLGPAGTFTEDALREAARRAATSSRCARATVHDAILAVERGEAERALVPFENSIEGSVRSTLDTLAFDAERGDDRRRARLRGAGPSDRPRGRSSWSEIEAVLSHPQPLAQCARFLREQLPGAERAQRQQHRRGGAARQRVGREPLGGDRRPRGRRALRLRRSCARGSRTSPTTSPASSGSPRRAPSRQGDGPWKTSLVFSELGEDHPGALVDALREFSSRGVNLTRIESRPLRQGLGRYMFFCDLEGRLADEAVAEAIEALRGKAESVRILGSYPVA